MPDAVTPALTPEEWARSLNGLRDRKIGSDEGRPYNLIGALWDAEYPHALAALCLYQQPFGFTRDDVTICLEAAAFFRERDGCDGPDARWFDGLATRIAALLPPEEDAP